MIYFFTALSALAIILTWFLLGFRIIGENERGVKIFLGNPYDAVESGLRWAPWLFVKILIYPTGIVELGAKPRDPNAPDRDRRLEFERAGIITKKGKSLSPDDKEIYGPANIGADVSFRFFWPTDPQRLIKALKALPDPENLLALTDLFEETVLEHVRTVGGHRTWVDLARDRTRFSADILESIKANPESIIDEVDSPSVAIKHLEIPPALLAALTLPEIARLEKEATITKAEAEKARIIQEGEGTKQKKDLEGQGDAAARKSLFDAIGDAPESLQKEAMLTLREMAKGTSNTILFPIPSELTDVFGKIFGKNAPEVDLKKIFDNLSDGQKKKLATMLTQKEV